MGLIFLDRQHSGQNHKRGASGASRDLDGDGKIEIHEMECVFTAQYLTFQLQHGVDI